MADLFAVAPTPAPVNGPASAGGFSLAGAIVTATLAFAAAMLLQLLVVPRAQARTRRRERWETSLSDLQAVIDFELPRSVDQYGKSASFERVMRSLLTEYRAMPEQPTAAIARAEDEVRRLGDLRRQADDALDESIRRLDVLSTRVRTYWRPDAPYWPELGRRVTKVRLATFLLTATPDDADVDEFRSRKKDVVDRLEDLVRFLDPLTAVMKPPPGPIRRRIGRWARRQYERLGRRKKPAA